MIEIINKPLLLNLVGYLYYWQMGFNSVFKGLNYTSKVIALIFHGTRMASNLQDYGLCEFFFETHKC